MAYERHLSRGLQSSIDETPLKDGVIRFAVDEARIFLDLVNERVEFTDFVKGLTSEEIKSLENPLPKIYLATDTLEILMYHAGEWLVLNSSRDSRGRNIDSTYIKEIKYNDNNVLVEVYGDGTEVEVSTSVAIANKLRELDEKINELNAAIEIIRNS